jgi:hypothetical protein
MKRSILLRWRLVLFLFLSAVITSGCNSDLFKPAKAPEISALNLDYYEVNPADTVTATVTVKDDDQNLTFEWTTDNGQFIPPTDGSVIKWKAPATGGTYHITVKVSNDKKSSSKSQSVTVRSQIDPSVEIVSPAEGSYWVQHSALSVSARASHENGIGRVDLYLNGKLKATSNGRADGNYAFTCPLDEPSGSAVVKVAATANVTGRVGADSVHVNVEGVVLGKPATAKF